MVVSCMGQTIYIFFYIVVSKKEDNGGQVCDILLQNPGVVHQCHYPGHHLRPSGLTIIIGNINLKWLEKVKDS